MAISQSKAPQKDALHGMGNFICSQTRYENTWLRGGINKTSTASLFWFRFTTADHLSRAIKSN